MEIQHNPTDTQSNGIIRGENRRLLGSLLEKINLDGIQTAIDISRNPKIAKPNFVWNTIAEIPIEELKEAGVRGIIFDLDGTLRDEGKLSAHPKVETILQKIITDNQLRVACLTNKVSACNTIFGNEYGVEVIEGIHKKPNAEGYLKAAARICIADMNKILMVGDSLSTDIVGGNLVGMQTALVDYRQLYAQPEKELWAKRFFGRRLDTWIMRELQLEFPPL